MPQPSPRVFSVSLPESWFVWINSVSDTYHFEDKLYRAVLLSIGVKFSGSKHWSTLFRYAVRPSDAGATRTYEFRAWPLGPHRYQAKLEAIDARPGGLSAVLAQWANARPRLMSVSVVYFILAVQLAAIKIGVTTDLLKRVAALQHACPDELRVLFVLPGGRKEEQAWHERFRAQHIRGEWFRFEADLFEYVTQVVVCSTERERIPAEALGKKAKSRR